MTGHQNVEKGTAGLAGPISCLPPLALRGALREFGGEVRQAGGPGMLDTQLVLTQQLTGQPAPFQLLSSCLSRQL